MLRVVLSAILPISNTPKITDLRYKIGIIGNNVNDGIKGSNVVTGSNMKFENREKVKRKKETVRKASMQIKRIERIERIERDIVNKNNSNKYDKNDRKNKNKIVKNKRLPYEINEYGCLMSLINILTGERHLVALSAQQTIIKASPKPIGIQSKEIFIFR